MEQRYGGLVRQWVTTTLTREGFRKVRESYARELLGLVWYFDLQRSRFNTEEKIEFTVNCGVFVPGVVSAYANRPARKAITLADCSVYARIGMLSESRTDLWWTLRQADNPETSTQAIGAELQGVIERLGLPFVRQFDSPAKVAGFLMAAPETAQHVNPMSGAVRCAYAAIIFSLLGDHHRQKVAIAMALDRARNSPLSEHIALLHERYA